VTSVVGAFVLSAGIVAQATGGRLVAGNAERPFGAVSTDTRSLLPGSLFVALRGDRFDGHAFVAEAVQRGAAGLLVAEDFIAIPEQLAVAGGVGSALPVVIAVSDTLTGLQSLGREIRRRSGARVVAITGSAGKTTTKEVTADLLSANFRVFRNPGNLNNHIGLPLSLTELSHGPDVAVVELGMNHAGEIRALIAIAEPDVRVWINVGDAHLGHFGSRDAVARAKAEILEGMSASTVVVANADDPLVMSHVAAVASRIVTFGERIEATVRASDVVDRGFEGTTATVATPAGVVRLAVSLPGRAQLMNVLAAVSVALEFGVQPRVIEERVAAVRAVARRGAVTTTPGGVRLVDDSYNASPAAMRAMLDALRATPVAGRRLAVLGEMLELGESSHDLHRESGRAAAAAGVDELVVVGGPDADGLAEGAIAAGLPATRVHRFAGSAAARDAVAAMIRAGDLVLVKGSRGTRMDLIADRLAGREVS
jgi:UDP-N-acetylmuramoyl-tripeptide--D-alanyl-D-alanine ligase